MSAVSRRMFFTAFLVATAARPRSATAALRWMDGGLPAGFPSQDPDVVALVVLKAHFGYDAVRELVTPRPSSASTACDGGRIPFGS